MYRLALALFLALPALAGAQQKLPSVMGAALENLEYPHPVAYLPLETEGQDLRMAYMDVKPQKPNGRSVVLFHGKNFMGAYWEGTIDALRKAGYRVIVPDQIGFGKSAKPDIHYSFHGLAANTRKLLEHLGVRKAAVVGHSMGGMLATRFALLYPDVAEALVLENPIGLEDYREEVPWVPLEQAYAAELSQTEDKIRAYHRTYYPQWKPEYDRWVQIQAGWTRSGEYPRIAWSSALTAAMIYQQPVVHEFPLVRVPALVVIGQEDRTVLGRGLLKPEQLERLGQYPALGRKTAEAIPDAKLVPLDGVGHIPHLEAPERFHRQLIDFLDGRKGSR